MNEVDRNEEVLEELLFTLVIYADKKSSSMAEVCATKWIVYPPPYRCRLPSPKGEFSDSEGKLIL